MKMKLYTSIAVILSIVIGSCKQSSHDVQDVVLIDDDDAIDVNFEDVATDVRVAPVKGDTLIGECYELQCYGNEAFIFDYMNKTIYYLVNNEYKSALKAVGRGPGEYTGIDDFSYCPDNKMLYVRTSRSTVLWYSVPEMKYSGKTQTDIYLMNFFVHDKNTFMVSSSIEDSIHYLTLVDIPTGREIKDIQNISGFASARSSESVASYRDGAHVYSLLGEINTVIRVSDDNEYQQLFKYTFGDKSMSDKFTEIEDLASATEFYNVLFSSDGYKYLCGGYFLKVKRNDISFWYTRLRPSLDNPYYCYYKRSGNSETNLKGFRVPGLKNQIYPKCITDDGYVTVFEGTSDMIIDPDTEPSPLAKKIIEAMDSQKDNNPVLLYFNIK